MEAGRSVLLTTMSLVMLGILTPTEADARVLSQAWSYGTSAAAYPVAGAGDVNGDGYDDVLVVFPKGDLVRLYLGSSSGLQDSASWTTTLAASRYVESVASAGDVNGDGYDDVVIGETVPSQSEFTNAHDGKARLYFGSATGLSNSPSWSVSRTVSRFGNSVAGAGDLNGDGYDDLVVGDPFGGRCPGVANIGEDDLPGSEVYVFYGSTTGISSQADWTYVDENDDGFVSCMGAAVAGAGDVDGDGYDDLLVGAPGYVESGNGNGRSYVFEGGSSGLPSSPDWAVQHPDANQNEYRSRYGSELTGVGDLNGDGYDDVAVTGRATYGGGDAEASSRGFVFFGSSMGLETSPAWTRDGLISGVPPIASGDIDADGYGDILFPFDTRFEPPVAMYHGSAQGVVETMAWNSDPGDKVPAMAAAGDVNGDGYDDVVVGSIDDGARVLHGGPNPEPGAESNSVEVMAGESVQVELEASDPADDPLTFSIASEPSQGSLSNVDSDNGSVMYAAPAEYEGSDMFSFRVEDPFGGEDTASVDVTVTAPTMDVGVDTGVKPDTGPDIGVEPDTGPDAADTSPPRSDLAWSQEASESGCSCSSANGPPRLPVSLVFFGATLLVSRLASRRRDRSQ